MKVVELFKKYLEEDLKFENIKHPENHRKDLCAFLMLAPFVERGQDIISAAEHDKIYFNVDLNALEDAYNAGDFTEAMLIDLIRCGVFVEEDNLVLYV
jgi:hypothetical protein